jgi:hypothetical protein
MMIFRGPVVQNLYGLSDDQREYQIEDGSSFQHNSEYLLNQGKTSVRIAVSQYARYCRCRSCKSGKTDFIQVPGRKYH